MTLIMNGKTINPKAIDQTEDQIISENIEDTMCQLVDIMCELSDSYDGLCELLADAGMDTKNATFTVIDGHRGVLTINGLDTLKCASISIFTDTSKSTVEAVYAAMLQFHDGPGSEYEDPNEFYYNMAKAIVDSMSKK